MDWQMSPLGRGQHRNQKSGSIRLSDHTLSSSGLKVSREEFEEDKINESSCTILRLHELLGAE